MPIRPCVGVRIVQVLIGAVSLVVMSHVTQSLGRTSGQGVCWPGQLLGQMSTLAGVRQYVTLLDLAKNILYFELRLHVMLRAGPGTI
jgi:hypothetical protein